MRRAGLLLLTLGPWMLAAAAGPRLYSNAELDRDKTRYAERFEFLLEKGLRDFMSPDERRALERVVIRHPRRGANPVTFKSVLVDGVPTVRAPVSSLKIIEDLSVAYAWRHTNRYSLEPMDEYLVMLKHRPVDDFPGGRVPAPLPALGVPPRVWERDARVDDLSLRFRNSAWAFVLAHELAHLRLGHTLTSAPPAVIQQQEEAADGFAVDLLSRSGTLPMGMILWFQATAGYLPNRADFATDSAYAAWLRDDAEHPVNGRRMRSLAATMQRQAGAERDRDRAQTLRFIALRLEEIAKIVEDPQMQLYLRRCATSQRLEDLRRLDDRPCL
jgi:hypothetical protein